MTKNSFVAEVTFKKTRVVNVTLVLTDSFFNNLAMQNLRKKKFVKALLFSRNQVFCLKKGNFDEFQLL